MQVTCSAAHGVTATVAVPPAIAAAHVVLPAPGGAWRLLEGPRGHERVVHAEGVFYGAADGVHEVTGTADGAVATVRSGQYRLRLEAA